MEIVTARLRLPPIDDAHLTAMQAGGHSPNWAADFPTPGDAMIAGLYAGVGLPVGSRDQLFAHRLVVETATGLVVGGIGVKGPPDDTGAVEIGYGIVASRQRRGYASEAVAGLCEALWADAEVQVVTAQVDPSNAASVGVLLRNNFVRAGRGAEYDDYALPRPAG